MKPSARAYGARRWQQCTGFILVQGSGIPKTVDNGATYRRRGKTLIVIKSGVFDFEAPGVALR